MSYCVNCGVELSRSERECPLCGVEVVNPRDPWREPALRPYPQRVERIVNKVNRKYVVFLLTLLLSVPAVFPVLTDLIFNRRITWSGFVVGAVICIFFFVLFPFLYARPRPYLYLAIDTAVLTVYVGLIESLSGGEWFERLGLPLVLILCATVSVFVYVIRRSSLAGLKKAAILFIVTAVSCVLTDFFISRFVGAGHSLLWSLFVVASNIILASLMLLLDRRQNLREEIIKRLFV